MNKWNNNYYMDGYETAVQAENEATLQRYVAGVMRRVYGKMAVGLATTAIAAYLVASSNTVMTLLFSSMMPIWILFAVELGLVIYLSARIDKLSTATAATLFYVYSLINGIVLAPIFILYTETSIATTFAITAGTFGIMSVAGYVTKKDLSKFGSICWSPHLHGPHRLGHPGHQAHVCRVRPLDDRQSRYDGRPEPLSRLHQPLPLPAPLPRQPQLITVRQQQKLR